MFILQITISLFKFLRESKQIVIDRKKEQNKEGYDDFRDINAIFKALELGAVIISVIRFSGI